MIEVEQDIDPDQNLLDNFNVNCCYYSEEQFNTTIKYDHGISIIHFNSRSLYANFQSIKYYLSQFKKPFNIIAVTETWINAERGSDFFIKRYGFHCTSRANGPGGGVALFVEEGLSYKVLDNLSVAIDDTMESITIEIELVRMKYVIVSCVYRKPGSNIDTFITVMERLFISAKQKNSYICGDYNIDLLNPNKHKSTEEFIELMYSMSLFPTITKPTRITSHCASLIDNIFTNNIKSKLISGILMNDISDHLPVFLIYECNYKKKRGN